jgi:UDP-2,3-diacylglucosamine hydrolase
MGPVNVPAGQSRNHIMAQSSNSADRYAIIAGNGRFPFLVLEGARAEGIEPLVVAIQEEASPDLSSKGADTRWVSLGEIAKFFELLKAERVNKVVLAGQVKHVQLFSNIRPDGLMNRALGELNRKNTDALIGTFVRMLSNHGIEVVDSTIFLKAILAGEGPLSDRRPDEGEIADALYGREIAKKLAGLDIGQTIVVAERACVAVEAMEGTDSTIERAASLSNGRRLVVVKVSKPSQDMRFDVPVVGPKTVQVMQRANASTLAVDAGKTLLFERQRLLEEANAAGIAIVGMSD